MGAQESRILGWDDHNLLAGTVGSTGGWYLTEGWDDHNLLAGAVGSTGGSYLTEGLGGLNLIAGHGGAQEVHILGWDDHVLPAGTGWEYRRAVSMSGTTITSQLVQAGNKGGSYFRVRRP
jgi:hypothetical protein